MSDSSDEEIVQVEKSDRKKKRISLKNIKPVSGISVVRSESSDSESSMSSDSSIPIKKTKRVLRPKYRDQPPLPTPRENNFEQNYDYSAFSNPKKVREETEELSEEESEYESEHGSYMSEQPTAPEKPKESYEDKQKMKQDLLIKIQALEKKGFEFSKKFTMTSNYEEMMFEYQKIKKFVETQAAIKFSRRCLMACVTGIEFLNKRFDPFHIKLEGWSENVMENVDDYDNIFEKLHEKYGGKREVAPEIELLLTLGGSAFMFHLTNTLLKGPGMNGMLAQNNPNFMANMMGAMSQGMKEMNRAPTGAGMAQMYQQQNQQQNQQNFPKPVETRSQRQEMRGPNIDPGLFNGTPLATNHPSNVMQPRPQTSVYDNQPIEEDDRFSIASSDSSLSSLGTHKKVTVKRAVPIKRGARGGKQNGGGGGGLELNIS